MMMYSRRLNQYFLLFLILIITVFIHNISIIENIYSENRLVSFLRYKKYNSHDNSFVFSEKLQINSIFCLEDNFPNYKEKTFNISNKIWSKELKEKYNIVIGRSWGSLDNYNKILWDRNNCNDILMLNRVQSCNERYGWDFFNNWINNNQNYLSHGNSQLDCMRNTKTNTLCKISNGIIDYSKIKIINNVRSVDNGFVLIYGHIKSDYFDFPEVIPGIKFTQDIQNIICDEIELRPTYVLSNDDIFNLGHYMNDVMMIWTMILLSNKNPSNSLLVNIDGLLENTPSGGLSHRIMDKDNPDNHGPYSLYYETWFNEIKKGIDYKNKKVCYKELYFPILPNIAWIWNDWFVENICSIQAPSPLFQSFNLFIRDHIIKKYPNTLQYDESIITILIDTRKDSKNNKKSSSRVIINIDSLIEAIKSVALDNIKVISIDYSELPFLEQIKIAHSASIFVGMHGAGRAHIIHAAIGMRNCCGYIELFPDESMDFYTIHGYSNLARMLGFHTYKYIPTLGSTNSSGTLLDVSAVTELVFKTINDVKYRPTCLHDIKNTSLPIFTLSPIT